MFSSDTMDDLYDICDYALNIMLVSTLIKTYTVIKSEKDAQILYLKNLQLLHLLLGPIKDYTGMMDTLVRTLDSSMNKRSAIHKKILGVPKSKINKQVAESLKTELEIERTQKELVKILPIKVEEFSRILTNEGKSRSAHEKPS